jgi:hypothetical protein
MVSIQLPAPPASISPSERCSDSPAIEGDYVRRVRGLPDHPGMQQNFAPPLLQPDGAVLSARSQQGIAGGELARSLGAVLSDACEQDEQLTSTRVIPRETIA